MLQLQRIRRRNNGGFWWRSDIELYWTGYDRFGGLFKGIQEMVNTGIGKGDPVTRWSVFEKLEKAEEFIRDINENWDCDNDAHKYNTPCRVCEAGKLLENIRIGGGLGANTGEEAK